MQLPRCHAPDTTIFYTQNNAAQSSTSAACRNHFVGLYEKGLRTNLNTFLAPCHKGNISLQVTLTSLCRKEVLHICKIHVIVY